MKKIFLLFTLMLVISGCSNSNSVLVGEIKKENIKMNICWMLPIGISEAMKPQLLTNLKANRIDADIKIFDQNNSMDFQSIENCELILVDELAGAIALKSNSEWRVVGRTNDLRIGILVPLESKINNFVDLKGKILGGHIGGVRILDNRSKKNGLDLKLALNFNPMNDEEIRSLVLKSNGKSWDKYDAIVVADNLMAYFQVKGLAKVIDQDIVVLPILARNNYIQENPEAIVDFFKAFSETLNDFRKNMISEKKLTIPGMPLDIAPSVYSMTYGNEDNFDEQGLKPFRFYFNKDEIISMQEATDIVFDFPFTKPRININDFIDLSYMEKAMERKTQP